MRDTNFRKYHIEKLKNKKEAILYLDIALQELERDGNAEAFLMALRDVAEAQGGMTKLADRIKMSRTSLYKALSAKGNPKIDTVTNVLKGLNLRLRIEATNTHKNNTYRSKEV